MSQWRRQSSPPLATFCRTFGAGALSFVATGKCFVASGKCFVATGKSFVATGKSFVATGKCFVASGKSFVPSGKSFARTGKSFARTGKSFARTGKSFVATGKCFVASGKSFLASGKSFVASGKSFVATRKSFARTGKCFVGTGKFLKKPRLLSSQPPESNGIGVKCGVLHIPLLYLLPMRKFPKEFADLLSPKGRAILTNGYAHANRIFHSNVTPLALLTGVIDVKKGVACSQLLNRKMYEHVRRVEAPIPPESISGMRKNYEECLPKTMRFKTAYFSSLSALSYRAAAEIGLVEMMKSESFAAFAEAITGLELERDPGIQAILYESGDYAGPHNDHHPENENAQRGFVDMHISLTNEGVASQYLVYQERGHFSKMYSVSTNGAVAVYKLPFWHFTTPLQAKKQMEREARRWLLLGSFDIKPETLVERGSRNGRRPHR